MNRGVVAACRETVIFAAAAVMSAEPEASSKSKDR